MLDATGCCPCRFSVPTAPMPPRQARQGLYLANRGFAVRQEGHMGRPQHRVRNSSSESRPPLEDACPLWMPCWVRFHNRGGRDDEQARQSGAVFEFRDVSFDFDFRGASIDGVKQSYAHCTNSLTSTSGSTTDDITRQSPPPRAYND